MESWDLYQLDQLFQDAKHRKFDIILVWKFDRFAARLKCLLTP